MEHISQKKIVISYLVTSFMIFLVSAVTSTLGLFGDDVVSVSGSMSTELTLLIHFIVVLLANAILHGLFYYGGLKSSPITKGVGLGMVLGGLYFMVCTFVFNAYDINTDPISYLASAMSGRMVEYSSGGLITAIISVSDIHKWGLLRAF